MIWRFTSHPQHPIGSHFAGPKCELKCDIVLSLRTFRKALVFSCAIASFGLKRNGTKCGMVFSKFSVKHHHYCLHDSAIYMAL